MNSKKDLIEFVAKQFRNVSKRIESKDSSLAGELKMLSKLLDEIISSDSMDFISPSISKDATLFSETTTKYNDNAVKPIVALKRIFDENPDSEFEAKQLKRMLEKIKAQGELLIKSKSILATTHTTLRVLWTQGYIERHENRPVTTYSKKK